MTSRNRTNRRSVLAGAFGLCLALTSGSAGATTLADPVGDTSSHDITSASGVYSASHWTLSATFEPGTLDASDLGFLFGLDTDQDTTTGVGEVPGPFFPLGAEVTVFYQVELNPTHARVLIWVPALGELRLATLVPVVFGTDSIEVMVPLSLTADLGGGMSFMRGDDGLALFGLAVGTLLDGGQFAPEDFVPDGADDGPLEGPTSFVASEPGLGGLAAAALAAGVILTRAATSS